MRSLSNTHAELRTHEAAKRIHEIEAILTPTSSDLLSTPMRGYERLQYLAPKEQWQTFASRIEFSDWARTENAPILWLGGTVNGRGACWVSSLTLDIADALESERGIDLACVLCDRGGESDSMSALAIFNTAIVQLLKARPEIVFERQFMHLLSPQILCEAGRSTSTSFMVLVNLVRMLGEQSLSNHREIFFIIDRIDLCSALASESEGKRFIQSLQKLNETMSHLRIIITSSTPAPELPALESGQQSFAEVWVDPQKPMAMYSR